MKLGSFAVQILAAVVVVLQQPLTVGSDGHCSSPFKSGKQAWRSEEPQDGNRGSHVSTAVSTPRPGTFLRGRCSPRGIGCVSRYSNFFFFPLLEVVPVARAEPQLGKIFLGLF